MNFFTYICGPQRIIYVNNFGDSMTCPLTARTGQSFHLTCEIFQHLQDGLTQTFVGIDGFRTIYPNDFGDPLTFPVAPQGSHLWF